MSVFSPRQMFLLDEACKPIHAAFGYVYLVGTAASRGTYRDVDVRCILTDDSYDAFTQAVGAEAVALLGIALGSHLAAATGLPIDFQFQRMTEANLKHDGKRNPLGVRDLLDYHGDAASEGENE